MKTEMRIFNNYEINGNEELMLAILICTLLHNQNYGWTVPYPYLMVCCKNVIYRSLHCLIKIVI
jgi:hypothetical protein